ncbi:MAG: hypothetical protein IKK68_01780 [Paludibacteraceae bacterium]|nr:hypothetical protein [Paludibacteraceae bacterium]
MNFQKVKGLITTLTLMALTPVLSGLNAANCYDTTAYIKTDINSGNPSYPFPQFLEYKGGGKTLAKYNAEGVTHADMEKTMREAYQIMSHRCRYEDTLCGVPYITFNNFEKHEGLDYGFKFCTEGDGYMLLASAIFADQPTFNGLWMWIHDNRIPKVKRYSDGEILFPNFEYNPGLASWDANGENGTNFLDGSATDGDEDIALALLIAYKQWGDTMMQNGKPVTDFNGNPISYRQMAKDYLSAFVDTFMYTSTNGDGSIYKGGHSSGDIGIDGYVTMGNKGGEITTWRSTQKDYPDITPNSILGNHNGYFDYMAPAYYHEFAKWLEEEGEGTDWQINQYRRGEASSDWLMGEAYKQNLIPSIGKFDIDEEDDTKVIFENFSEGEDFRGAWRTILNYLWHGNPKTTWNPKTHQIDTAANSFEYDMAVRYAEFLKRPTIERYENGCGKLGASPEPNSLNWFGPAQILQCYNMDGTADLNVRSNYALGCSAPSVVALGDEELLADIYRECELRWDANCFEDDITDDERNTNATAKYFHGWFRTLGMLVTSGNLAAPADMKSSANVKVYMSVDKTFAYKGENVSYDVQVRNYGSADAKDAIITTKLDADYEFVSATKGGTYNAANHSITWNIANIPGFKTGNLSATMDTVSFTVNVKNTENKLVGLTSTISGSNFDTWESNAYPNNATYTMERNLVDILDNPFALEKNVDTTDVSVNDTIEFTLKIAGNNVDWLNGGRDNVRLSYGNYLLENGFNLFQFFKFWHDAPEAYINMGNYRVSYYLNDTCGLVSDKNQEGLICRLDNENDALKYGYLEDGNGMEFTMEDIPTGADEDGICNKRIIMKFPNILSATTSHLETASNSKYLIHKGVWVPGLYRTSMKKNPFPIQDNAMAEMLADDWSFSDSVATKYLDGIDDNFTPITPGWYNEETLGDEITNYVRHTCDDDVTGFSRIVVEEWDGYTWRRIQGRGPVSGINYQNVVLTDSLPKELEFINQTDESGMVIKEENGKLSVEIPEIQTGKDIVLKYRCKVVENNGSNVIETGVANLSTSNNTIESNAPTLTVKTLTNVNNVEVSLNELVDVYNTNGALLKKQVEYKNALNGLLPGVYMVNGVKTIVK